MILQSSSIPGNQTHDLLQQHDENEFLFSVHGCIHLIDHELINPLENRVLL
jgi:hypothetical protein